MGNSNGGSGGMVILLVLGGVCCLSIICSAGSVLLYNTNPGFKDTIDGLFNGGGGGAQESPDSGNWVCPDPPQGYEDDAYELKNSNGDYWCQHPRSGEKDAHPLIKNHTRASKLPNPAVAGKTYRYDTIDQAETDDGEAGVFGPSLGGFGSKDGDISMTAFKYTASMPDKK